MTSNSHQKPSPDFSPSSRNYYGWFVIMLCLTFAIYKYILQVSPSVMTSDLIATFHMTGAGLGNLGSCFFYGYFLTQLVVGPLLDRFNPKYLTMGAVALGALGAALFSYANTVLIADTGRIFMGIGAAFATVSYFKMASIWFSPRFYSLLSGLLVTAAMAGSIAGQTPLAFLSSWVGWRYSMAIIAGLGVVIALMFLLVPKNAPYEQKNLNLEKSNLTMWQQFKKVFRIRANWMLMLYVGLAFVPVAVLGGLWGNPYLQAAYHLNSTQAANYISLVFLGLAFGGPFFTWATEKFQQRFQIMFFGGIISTMSLLVAIYYPNLSLWEVGVLLFVFGFTNSPFIVGYAIAKESNDAGLAATVAGFINSGEAILGAITEPLLGKLLDWLHTTSSHTLNNNFSIHDFHVAFLLLGAYLIIAIALVWLLKPHIEATQKKTSIEEALMPKNPTDDKKLSYSLEPV